MIPGEYMLAAGEVVCNAASEGREVVLEVANTATGPFRWVRTTIFMRSIRAGL